MLHTDAIEVQMGRRPFIHTHTHLASMIDITISRQGVFVVQAIVRSMT